MNGGVVYGIARSELPACRTVLEMRAFLTCELGTCLVDWFERVKALDKVEEQVDAAQSGA